MSARFSFSFVYSIYFYLLVAYSFQLCLSNLNPDGILCIEPERQALLRFKHGLVDEGNRLASWTGEDIECCKWAGVDCDNSTGFVHAIHLPALNGHCRIRDYGTDKEYREASKQRFNGNLSSSLLQLRQLKYLDLSCNDFEGVQVPSFIGSLENLLYLNLSNSEFGGIIPPQLGNLSKLHVLGLVSFREIYEFQSTRVSNMQWLSSLRSLQHLDMSGVDLSKADDWLQVIESLPSLVQLHLSSCQLSNIQPGLPNLNISSLSLLNISFNYFNSVLPRWIFGITTLVSLDLSMHEFQGFIPSTIDDSFRNLTSLEILHVSGNDFMNSSLVLEGLSSSVGSNLVSLDISYCGISSPVLDTLHNLTSLVSLYLSGNQLTKTIPKSLGNLCNLRSLDMSNRRSLSINLTYFLESLFECESPALESLFLNSMVFSGHLPDQLGQLIHLEHLELESNLINGTITSSIGRLSSLRTLSLLGNQITGPIPHSIRLLSSLEVLDLAFNNLNGSVPRSFGQLSKLIYLDISYNHLTGLIPNSMGNLSSLNWLDISNNQFTGSLPDSIGQLTSLKMMDLSYNVLDGSVPYSIGHLLFLEVLDLSENSLNGSLPESIGKLSLLEVLDLSYNLLNGVVPDSFGQLSKLKNLDFSYNFLTGPVPISVGSALLLENLDLSNNKFTGTLPYSLGHLQSLKSFYVNNNLLNGTITVQHFANLTSLKILRAENNKLTLHPNVENWVPPFNLEVLRIGSWNLGPRFPSWIRSQGNLTYLDISNTGISDIMPSWFWSSFSDISFLNISHNNIQGKLTANRIIFGLFPVADFSNNHFEGLLPAEFNEVDFVFLDVSNNYLSGSLDHFLCPSSNEDRKLWVLDVANNNISGVIPDCWLQWWPLMILNLENNGLSGGIPQSVGNLSRLQVFNARNNKLSGNLSALLFNLRWLVILELAENEFTGCIPWLLGNEESELKILSLRSNKLEGGIPDELCRFTSIRILDLAHNNLSGTLPSCFYNFSSMSEKQNLSTFLEVEARGLYGSHQVVFDFKMQVVLLATKGSEYEYSTTLFLVTEMDLSGNRFSGPIPKELMGLVGLRYMNLSRNHLNGRIPDEIGKMASLESLDLSLNQIDGTIPWSISSLTSLNSLNLSFNELTGEIPKSTQLQSLAESSFIGNTLCGPPLENLCNQIRTSPDAKTAGEGEQKDDGSDAGNWGFIISIVVGFVIGFWGVVTPLIVSKVWRNAYFYFLYKLWFKIRIACYRYF